MAYPTVPKRDHILPPVGSLIETLKFPINHVIVGPPGSGKTILALHVAHRAATAIGVDFVVASEHLVRWLRAQVVHGELIAISTWRHWLAQEFATRTNGEPVPVSDPIRRLIDWEAIARRSLRSDSTTAPSTRQLIVDEAQDVPIQLIRLMEAWGYPVLLLADPAQRFAEEGSDIGELVDAINSDGPWPVDLDPILQTVTRPC